MPPLPPAQSRRELCQRTLTSYEDRIDGIEKHVQHIEKALRIVIDVRCDENRIQMSPNVQDCIDGACARSILRTYGSAARVLAEGAVSAADAKLVRACIEASDGG